MRFAASTALVLLLGFCGQSGYASDNEGYASDNDVLCRAGHRVLASARTIRYVEFLELLRAGEVDETIRLLETDLALEVGAMELGQPTLSRGEPRLRTTAVRSLEDYLAHHPEAAVSRETRAQLAQPAAPENEAR